MKQLIIFLLVIILLLIGYNTYSKYKRFSPPEYQYKASENIDVNYHDKAFLLDYYESIEGLNGFVISQWSNNRIDVRNPEDDDDETKAAMQEYAKKLGEVKYYEGQLVHAAELKTKGHTNSDIKLMQEEGISSKVKSETKQKAERKAMFKAMYDDAKSRNALRLGSRNAFVYELQKILVNKGYDIPVDGVFKNVTADAVRAFEEKNQLFPDGVVDILTFEKLME